MAKLNPNEARAADDAVLVAKRLRTNVRLLPQDIGAEVQWRHTGVVWRRVDDDRWTSLGVDGEDGLNPNLQLHTSMHVASLPYRVTRWTPAPEKEES